jgi:hypothetical protein
MTIRCFASEPAGEAASRARKHQHGYPAGPASDIVNYIRLSRECWLIADGRCARIAAATGDFKIEKPKGKRHETS